MITNAMSATTLGAKESESDPLYHLNLIEGVAEPSQRGDITKHKKRFCLRRRAKLRGEARAYRRSQRSDNSVQHRDTEALELRTTGSAGEEEGEEEQEAEEEEEEEGQADHHQLALPEPECSTEAQRGHASTATDPSDDEALPSHSDSSDTLSHPARQLPRRPFPVLHDALNLSDRRRQNPRLWSFHHPARSVLGGPAHEYDTNSRRVEPPHNLFQVRRHLFSFSFYRSQS